MSLNFIVSVRHGAYSEETGNLLGEGLLQAQALATAIKDKCGTWQPKGFYANSIGYFTSAAPRAIQFAKAVAYCLTDKGKPCRLKKSDYFWVGNGAPDLLRSYSYDKNDERAMELVKGASRGLEMMIVITHATVAEPIANAFLRMNDRPLLTEKTSFGLASGVYIDLRNNIDRVYREAVPVSGLIKTQ